MEYDVFISYSRKDSAVANRIHDTLAAAGINCFIDLEGISGGMDFPTVLADAIMNSRILLLVASENSYASEFTRKELTFAVSKKGSSFIFPLIIDKSSLPTDLEFLLSNINWRTLSSSYRIENEMLDDVRRKLENPHAGETLQQRAQSNILKFLVIAFAVVLLAVGGYIGNKRYSSNQQKKHQLEVRQARSQCEQWLSETDMILSRNDSLIALKQRERTFEEEKQNLSLAGVPLWKADSLRLKYREEDAFKGMSSEISDRKANVKEYEDQLFIYWRDSASGLSGFIRDGFFRPIIRRYVDNALSIRPDDPDMLSLKAQL